MKDVGGNVIPQNVQPKKKKLIENTHLFAFIFLIKNVSDGAEHTLSKSAYDVKLGGVPDVPEACAAIQRDRRRLEGQPHAKGYKYISCSSEGYMQTPAPTEEQTLVAVRAGDHPAGKDRSRNGPWGSGVHQTEHEPECALKA